MYKKYVYYMYLTVLFGFHSNAATFHLLVCTLFAVTVLKVLLLHALCPPRAKPPSLGPWQSWRGTCSPSSSRTELLQC